MVAIFIALEWPCTNQGKINIFRYKYLDFFYTFAVYPRAREGDRFTYAQICSRAKYMWHVLQTYFGILNPVRGIMASATSEDGESEVSYS